MQGQTPWTDTIITAMKLTWSEGRPAAEIARRLNVSKNSVIGKARRLGLPRRPSPIRYSEGERKQQIKACRRVRAIFRIDCCCWPLGDPDQAASSSASNLLYRANRTECQEHANRAYVRKHVNKVEAINSGSHV